MAARGVTRFLHRHGLMVPRLIINGGGAVETPFHISPQASAATGTAVEGDIQWVNADNAPSFYDGSARQIVPGLGAANSWSGVNTFATTPVITAGAKRTVVTAATTLTIAQSGALCLFNAAAGFTYTLPAPSAGLWYDFLVTVSVTSVAAKLITNAGTVFLVGGFTQVPDTAAQIVTHAANGTTIVSWNGNGTTTGGYIGDTIRVTCISATQWAVSGLGLATGTEATPFAAS